MKYIALFLLALVYSSCGGGSGDGCSMEYKKKYIYTVMHDSYFWADEVPSLTQKELASYEDEEKLLTKLISLKDKSRNGDPFTHIMKKKDHDDFFEAGVSVGFGFIPMYLSLEDNKTMFFSPALIYPNSPAAKAGLKRGDIISDIDGIKIINFKRDKKLYAKYFINDEENLTMNLKFRDGRNLVISKKEFDLKTVIKREIINQNGIKIGYIMFQSFIGTAKKEIDDSFTYFKDQHIDELVLDMRYNGGGYVSLANHLGALIGGDRVSKTVFNKSEFNKKYAKYGKIEYFEKTPKNALNLSRVFIITMANTCSASELVINSLKSRTNSVEVIQVGDATCGKPYAMISMPYCDKYILPVQMRSANGDGYGDYATGLEPDCKSFDDIRYAFGDKNEDSLSNALYFIKNNSCKKVKVSKSLEIEKKPVLSGFRGMYGLF